MVVGDQSFWSGFALFAKSTKLSDFCTVERPEEITESFLNELDRHIADIVSGRKTVFYEIHDFAALLCIHPTHLSNTVKGVTGKAPCDHCEGKLAIEAKRLLQSTQMSITQIAYLLTYDPPGFTRFFKKYVGLTPRQYRTTLTKGGID
jgi:AraC family transcriptional regulator of adaptative response / methylphosphotriester-DNA alkyltransferase methyltransferase